MKTIIASVATSFFLITYAGSVRANPALEYDHPQCVQEKLNAHVVLYGAYTVDQYIVMDYYGECGLHFDEEAIYPPVPEECLNARVAEFRVHAGPEAPIRFDVLEEWSEECRSEHEVGVSKEASVYAEYLERGVGDDLSPEKIISGLMEAMEWEERHRLDNPHGRHGVSFAVDFLQDSWNEGFGFFLLATPIKSWQAEGSCAGHIQYAMNEHVPYFSINEYGIRVVVDGFCKNISPVDPEASFSVRSCFDARAQELHQATGVFPSSDSLKDSYSNCVREVNDREFQAAFQRGIEEARLKAQRKAAVEANAPTLGERLQALVSLSSDVEVAWRTDGFRTWIEITATEDRVVLRDVKVNRGNCRSVEVDPAIRYEFGQKAIVGIGCSHEALREVEVTTNRGTFKFDL